jgi:hypothetical protein
MHRLRLQIANGRMRRFRSVPVSRRAWYVTLTAIDASEKQFAPGELVAGCSFEPRRFWVHSRRLAERYVWADQDAGGHGSAFSVAYRRCQVCGQVLLSQAADDYRKALRRPQHTWHYPQGPACSVDCAPPAIIRNSKYRKRNITKEIDHHEQ